MSSEGSSSDDESYGPALPPHMLLAKKTTEELVDEEQAKEDDSRGRSAAVIGPSLPPGFKPSTSMTQPDEQLDDEQVDPSPARRVVTTTTIKSKSEVDHYNLGSYKEEEGNSDEDNDDDDDDDDEDIVGPFPPDHPKAQQQTHSYNFPSKTDSSKPKREEWMLIPPKNKPISGLAARKFLPRSLETRKDNDADDDNNDEDNEKQDLKERFQSQLIEKRDELMSNLISESGSGSSDRSESLLQIHRKSMKRKHEEEKKKAGADASKKERRPFDRDQDLQVHGMNEDDKQRFIKRATSELQGRFSHGKKAGKFL